MTRFNMDFMKEFPDATVDLGEEPSWICDLLAVEYMKVLSEFSAEECDEFLDWMRDEAAKEFGIKCQASRVALRMWGAKH